MAEILSLGPFAGVRDLSWGGAASLVLFHHEVAPTGESRVTAQVFDAEGRRLSEIAGLVDLVADGDGGLVGLRQINDGANLALFTQPLSRRPPSPDLQTAAFPLVDLARLVPWPDGDWLVVGQRQQSNVAVKGAAASGAVFASLLPPIATEDLSGFVRPGLGMPNLQGRLLLGAERLGPADADPGASIALESTDAWTSHRAIRVPGEAGSGPVHWRATGLAAWDGRFWIAATRETPTLISHRLYVLPPGGSPSLVAETGQVAWVDGQPRPRGVMIRALSATSAPGSETGGKGGLWGGDRLIMAAQRCAATGAGGIVLASGVDGLLVVAPGAEVPTFHPCPEGAALAAAHCLGAGPEAPWLCRLQDGSGGVTASLTRDFRTWTLDPFPGDPPPPPGRDTTSRYGIFGLAAGAS